MRERIQTMVSWALPLYDPSHSHEPVATEKVLDGFFNHKSDPLRGVNDGSASILLRHKSHVWDVLASQTWEDQVAGATFGLWRPFSTSSLIRGVPGQNSLKYVPKNQRSEPGAIDALA